VKPILSFTSREEQIKLRIPAGMPLGKIRTVLGDIHPSSLGLTLPHEHVMCDFIGAKSVDRSRYDRREVVRTMLPYLLETRQLGVTGFVDCTPAFIGRDPIALAELSRLRASTF